MIRFLKSIFRCFHKWEDWQYSYYDPIITDRFRLYNAVKKTRRCKKCKKKQETTTRYEFDRDYYV